MCPAVTSPHPSPARISSHSFPDPLTFCDTAMARWVEKKQTQEQMTTAQSVRDEAEKRGREHRSEVYKGEFRRCHALWENYRMEAKDSWGVPPAVRNGVPFAILWGKQLE